jgi:dethiobiotin synthetase
VAGLLVTGTGTGVGKTALAAALAAALVARGLRVAAFKPVVTGTADRGPSWPEDHALLAAVTGARPQDVAPLRFGPAVSPHLAAELAGNPIDPAALLGAARAAADGADVLICEGVGGLLVPLTPTYLVRDFARELGLPVLIAASPWLGTINHSLLTLEAARAAGLDVRALVLTPWPATPDTVQRSNLQTIAALGDVPVATLARVASPRVELLAAAGAALPIDDWLDS